MENRKQSTLFNIKREVRRQLHKIMLGKKVPLYWWRGEQNWGDALNPVLAKLLSEQEVKFTNIKYCDGYLAVGSVLSLANSNATVWGSGFMAHDQTLQERPRSIRAVRGPLTRAMLLDQGVDCPETYGDPALLLPLFYNKDLRRKYRLGLIPHYLDADHPWVKELSDKQEVLLIDVKSGIFEFVDAVKSCEFIVSSSLHGLICADAYGIPNMHIELSKNVIGSNFKFNDYAASVGRPTNVRLDADIGVSSEDVICEIQDVEVNADLKSLLLSCPFLSENLRRKVNDLSAADLSLAAIRKSEDSVEMLRERSL